MYPERRASNPAGDRNRRWRSGVAPLSPCGAAFWTGSLRDVRVGPQPAGVPHFFLTATPDVSSGTDEQSAAVGGKDRIMAETPAAAADPTSAARPLASARRLLLPLALAQFICSFAGSNMNVMINDISEDLNTSVKGVQTAITLFLLIMAILMIPCSKLTDRWGRKRCFMGGLALYGVGALVSAVCAEPRDPHPRELGPRGRRHRVPHPARLHPRDALVQRHHLARMGVRRDQRARGNRRRGRAR